MHFLGPLPGLISCSLGEHLVTLPIFSRTITHQPSVYVQEKQQTITAVAPLNNASNQISCSGTNLVYNGDREGLSD